MKRMLSFLLTAIMIVTFCMTAIPVSAVKTEFIDVAGDRWSASAIQYAVVNGYMKGVGDDKFDPEGSLTRAMVATVLWRREGEPKPAAQSGFADVPANEWYADAVAWAKETEVVKGLTETAFGPDEYITREQLATMLFRFSSTAPVSVPERADLSPFADDEKVSDWAGEPLGWAVEAGLIKGTDGNRLAPDGNATREQFAAIIERYDGSFRLAYNEPVLFSQYTEPEYPLVEDADFYVSTTGDDSADGSFDHPFRTWERARDAVRTLDRTGRDGITVAFMAGDYGPLSLELTAEDSGTPECPITYCKYGDGDVVFNNGFDCSADDFIDLTDEERALFAERFADRIKKTDVSFVFDAAEDPDGILIYCADGMMTKARFPNKYTDGTDNLPPAAVTYGDTSLEITLATFQKRLASYGEEAFSTMEIWGHIIRGYRKDVFKVAGYDADTHILEIANWQDSEMGVMRPEWAGTDGMGIDMCISNIPYELDYKNEYWIDPVTQTLYVFEPEGSYFFPGPGTMLTMDHADDVKFLGIDFRNAVGRFISAETCHGVTLDRCDFSGTSAIEGVYFNDNSSVRPMDLTVRGCTFSNSYGHALYVNGNNTGEHKFEKKTGVVFDNNLVKRPNILYDDHNGVHFYRCTYVSVTHNRFEDCPRGAVSFTHTSDVTVEYNDFDSAMLNSNDGGVIYSDWICDARGLAVRYNYFGYVPTAGAGQFGLYLDEFSSGYEIYSNIFYKTGNSAAMITQGRDTVFRNNVLISNESNYGLNLVSSSRRNIEELGSIEAATAAGTWGLTHGPKTWGEFFDNCANSPGYRSVIEERWPEMLKIHFDYDNMDDPYFALNQTTLVKGNAYFNRDGGEYRVTEKYPLMYTTYDGNSGYTFDENPVFVNPTLGDYRIRGGAEFPDIRFEKIGRY